MQPSFTLLSDSSTYTLSYETKGGQQMILRISWMK